MNVYGFVENRAAIWIDKLGLSPCTNKCTYTGKHIIRPKVYKKPVRVDRWKPAGYVSRTSLTCFCEMACEKTEYRVKYCSIEIDLPHLDAGPYIGDGSIVRIARRSVRVLRVPCGFEKHCKAYKKNKKWGEVDKFSSFADFDKYRTIYGEWLGAKAADTMLFGKPAEKSGDAAVDWLDRLVEEGRGYLSGEVGKGLNRKVKYIMEDLGVAYSEEDWKRDMKEKVGLFESFCADDCRTLKGQEE